MPPAKTAVVSPPVRIVDNLGKSRVGDTVGLNDNQLGPVALVAYDILFAPETVELSSCSQLYVSTSPGLASVAEAVNAKGVLIGMV